MPKEGVRASDYVFTLSDTHGLLEEDLEPVGEAQFAPYRSTLLRIEGRRRGGRSQVTLGTGIALTVDEGDCLTRQFGAAIIEALEGERAILRELCDYIDEDLRTRRLLAVRIAAHGPRLSFLEIVMCPRN